MLEICLGGFVDALMIFGFNVGWLRLELLLGIIPGNLSDYTLFFARFVSYLH